VQTRELGLVDDDQSDGKWHLVEKRQWAPQHIYTARKVIKISEIRTMGWSPIIGREGSSRTGLGVIIIFGCICSFLLRVHVERTCRPEQGLLSLASYFPCSTIKCGTSHWP